MGKAPQQQPAKKHNLFVNGVLKSAGKLGAHSTDLAEIEEICESLPVSDPTCAALALMCCHNNTQVREKIKAVSGEDPGLISFEEMSKACGQMEYEYTATDFALIITELTACGVLSISEDGFYRVVLYSE